MVLVAFRLSVAVESRPLHHDRAEGVLPRPRRRHLPALLLLRFLSPAAVLAALRVGLRVFPRAPATNLTAGGAGHLSLALFRPAADLDLARLRNRRLRDVHAQQTVVEACLDAFFI